MSKNFQPLSSGEVLSVNNDAQFVIGHSTFRVSEFTEALKQLILEHGVGGITPETLAWLNGEGIACDVLRFGSTGWVKGKVRLHLEFAEDEGGEVSPDPKSEAATESLASVAAIATPQILSTADEDFGSDEFDLGFDEESATTSADVAEESETGDFDLDFGDEATPPELNLDLEDDLGFEDSDLGFEEEPSATAESSADFGGDLDLDFAETTESAESSVELEDDLGFDDLDLDFDADEVASQGDDKATMTARDTFVQGDEEDSLGDLLEDEAFIEESASTSDELDNLFDEEDEFGVEEESAADDLDLDGLGDPFAEAEESGVEITPAADLDDSLDDLFDEEESAELFEEEMTAEAPAETAHELLDDFDLGMAADDGDEFGLGDLEEDSSPDSEYGAIALGAEDEEVTEDDFSLEEFSGEAAVTNEGEEAFDDLMAEDIGSPEDGADLSFDDLDTAEAATAADDPFAEFAEEDADAGLEAMGDDESFDDFLEGDSAEAGAEDFSFGEANEDTAADLTGELEADFALDEGTAEATTEDASLDLEAELPPEIDFGSTADLGEFINVTMLRKKALASPPPAVETIEAEDEDRLPADIDLDADDDFGDLNMDEASPVAESPFALEEADFGELELEENPVPAAESAFDLGDDDFSDAEEEDSLAGSPFALGDDEFSDFDLDESPVPAAVDSPFDLGDDDFGDLDATTNPFQEEDDDDIGLGELLDDGEDDFDFDALGADPLDAVTGEEEVVSADIWDLE